MNSKLLTNMKIELKQDVLHLIKRINDLASSFNINKKIILLKNINSEIQSTNFWNDKRKAVLLEKQRIKLFNELENYNKIKKGTLDCYELLKIIKEEEFDLKDIKQEIDNSAYLVYMRNNILEKS